MNGEEATKQKHIKQKNMVYEPCRHDLFEQDLISASLGPDSAEKKIHESDNSSEEDEDYICLVNDCDIDYLSLNTSDLDDDNNKDTKHYESSCEEDSVAEKNDD